MPAKSIIHRVVAVQTLMVDSPLVNMAATWNLKQKASTITYTTMIDDDIHSVIPLHQICIFDE